MEFSRFGVSGIMTFLVNQDSVVFQKDLGAGTAAAAAALTRFDPDLGTCGRDEQLNFANSNRA